MKKRNVLLKAIAVLAIVLISLISFLGIHERNLNNWVNTIPEYQFSKELGQTRIYGFSVDKSVQEEEEDEQNTDESEVTETTEESETTETVEETKTTEVAEENKKEEEQSNPKPVNDPAVLTKANYKKTKEIIEQRLRTFGITDTNVNVNEKNGEITIYAPYEETSNNIIDLVTSQGKIEVVDSETSEVLIGKDLITNVTAYYEPSNSDSIENEDTTYYDFGVRITFNSAGQKKLRELSKKYIATTDENGEESQKTITVKIDGKDRFTTWFPTDQEFTELPVKLHQYISPDDEDSWNDAYTDCMINQTTLKSDTLPIVYELTSGSYIESNLDKDFIKNITIIALCILAIVIIFTIAKYKKLGVFASIIEVGYIAIHLLLIRVAGVKLALSGIFTIGLMAIANYLLIISLINKEKVINKIESFGKFIIIIIPFIITMIAFTLGKDINVQSIGMVGTWGILTFACTLVAAIILLNTPTKNGVENNEE